MSVDTKLPSKLINYISELEKNGQSNMDVILSVLKKLEEIEVIDLWEDKELSVSYWILLINGINKKEEVDIAKKLLIWKSFFAKDSATVRCIQSSERRDFNFCACNFGIKTYPSLIIADSATMDSYICIDINLLIELDAVSNNLQAFFQKLHQHLENGGELKELKKEMKSEQFWSNLKIIYKEVKGLFTISLQE